MKPLGRSFYKDNTGGKHHVRVLGKFRAWWFNIIPARKCVDRALVQKDIQQQLSDIEDNNDD